MSLPCEGEVMRRFDACVRDRDAPRIYSFAQSQTRGAHQARVCALTRTAELILGDVTGCGRHAASKASIYAP
jgi:hypothetical protein